MKKINLVFFFSLTFISLAKAQHFYGEDAFRFSNFGIMGTARTQAMGNAFTALGGDISNTVFNPAGLAFFNKNEFSFSPVFDNQNINSSYLGSSSSLSSSNLKLGQIGAVFSKEGAGSRLKRFAWGITYNKLANFNKEVSYSGVNQNNSMIYNFATKATNSGYSTTELDDQFDSQTNTSTTPESMYYQMFLINPTTNGQYVPAETTPPFAQSGLISEKGSLGQFNLSFAGNLDDKTYIGGGIGLQNINYSRFLSHTENFTKGINFNSYNYQEELFIKGTGVNFNLGGIFKVTKNINIGAHLVTPTWFGPNLLSPTWFGMSETYYSSISVDPKPGVFTSQITPVSTVPNDYSYKITSPFRGNIGAAFFLPKQMGVISVEGEYVGYSNMGVKDKNDKAWSSQQNRGIQDTYEDAFNLKAGAELRFGNGRLRAGVQNLANPIIAGNTLVPYINSKRQTLISFGGGLRTDKYFADLAYNIISKTDGATSYDTYADVKYGRSQKALTFSLGFYF